MKKFLRINLFVLITFVFLVGFTMPQGLASASQQIHLHIDGEKLDKDTKVTLIYKDDKKDKVLSMSRQNGSLYKAKKPSGFKASLDVQFKLKLKDKNETHKPTKVTGKNGTINYWIDNGKETEEKEEDPVLKTFTLNKPVNPFVKDIYNNGDGTFTVYWGYENHNDVKVDAKVSILTSAAYVYSGLPVQKDFSEGRVEEAFKTVFVGPSITWELTGPDGVKRTATAFSANAKTYKAVQPLLTGVYKNVNGSYTAYWGYHNENNVSTDVRVSQFFPVLTTQPMKTNFVSGLVLDAFSTNFTGSSSITWNLLNQNGVSLSASADINSAKSYNALSPTVKAVYENGDGTYTAYWGYQNHNDVTVEAIDSKFISGVVISSNQPMKKEFRRGAHEVAFSTVFRGTHLTWELTGPDGQKRIVTAHASSAVKYQAIVPTVNRVITNGDGTFTAIWGYLNHNGVVVDALESKFTGTVLKNEVAKKDNFLIGSQINTFETTFKGTEMSWHLKGPDGVIRTVTAFAKDAVIR